jgi:hypothetical protein
MTLNKHQIQGLPKFKSRVLAAENFEKIMMAAGYIQSGSAPAQNNRIKIWWVHNDYPRVESIYSSDKNTVITAYHVS